MYSTITRCRACGNTHLVSVLSLGEQYLTGIFPCDPERTITRGPLELVKCQGDSASDYCGLVQLRHSYDLGEMYGENYGYRSSLNKSMVAHLSDIVAKLTARVPVGKGDLVIDIGSNDGTLLSHYSQNGPTLVGMDPSAERFRKYYRDDIQLIVDFFPGGLAKAGLGGRKAKIVTSIAMFYDLEDPIDFMRKIESVLAEDGVWHFEQSYMPEMLRVNAYDTICHEHLEYYGLTQVQWMARRTGLKLLDVEINDVNGGSFAVTAAKESSPHQPDTRAIEAILAEEKRLGLHTLVPYEQFAERVFAHRDALLDTLRRIKAERKTIFGYGASTKGNVILQFCGLTREDLPCIAEVNADKFGCSTPGTKIPIVPEQEARAKKPDYFLVLPWHFKRNLLEREAEYLRQGGRMLFPLPEIEVVPS
ncbi:MAG TPA: class I SAM-dependent methyltransferase [Tepidisphaeraceae bacterium]|nr:class I SAM-dependent methyltransferase [Tepidisphaeraceae bacterium]